MPRTIEKIVYQYGELSDKAKEKARQWYRDASAQDSDWYDFIFDDAARMASILGIEIATQTYNTVGGGTSAEPAIYFSGFWNQGDGACFEGRYSYAKQAHKAIRKEAPQDNELHRIADALFELQKANGYKIEASVKHRGRYSHKYCTEIDVTDSRTGNNVESDDVEANTAGLLRDFMDWIYKQLESEWEYRNSDGYVTETIEANGYEFNEDGRRACV